MVSSASCSSESQILENETKKKKEPKSSPPETYRFNAAKDTAGDSILAQAEMDADLR